jgi:hypothetical protein
LESFTETRSTADAIESSANTSSLLNRSRTNENFNQIKSHTTFPSNPISNDTSQVKNSSASNTAGITTMAVFHSDFGQNPWDFDVLPDGDFVNQASITQHIVLKHS